MKNFPVLRRILFSLMVFSGLFFIFSKTELGRYYFEGQKILLLRLAHGESFENYDIKSLGVSDKSPKTYEKVVDASMSDYPIDANVGDKVTVSVEFLYKNEYVNKSCIIKVVSSSCDASIDVKGKELFCSDTCERSF